MMKKFSSNRATLLRTLALGTLSLLCSCSLAEQPATTTPLNTYVLAAIQSMPDGKGYDASQAAVDRLAASVTVKDSRFDEDLGKAASSFCSGATYVVFLRAIDLLQEKGQVKLSAEALSRYANLGVKDGEEIFGRWNANGPGTAKLFAELRCGSNFISYEKALPGDFMKIWWTDEIGGRERGHSVVYLGSDGKTIRYWSSNIPAGYGEASVAKSKIKRVLFSRLERHDRLERATRLSPKNTFLAGMLTKPFTWDQVVKECRVTQ
ncbi:hypothetical protein V2O64_03435 [Verrucomicrobiaceae bacterium 227]